MGSGPVETTELPHFHADHSAGWLACSLIAEVPALGQPGNSCVHTVVVRRVSREQPLTRVCQYLN